MAATCVLRASRLYMYLCIPVGSSAALRVRAMACRPRASASSVREVQLLRCWVSGAACTRHAMSTSCVSYRACVVVVLLVFEAEKIASANGAGDPAPRHVCHSEQQSALSVYAGRRQ